MKNVRQNIDKYKEIFNKTDCRILLFGTVMASNQQRAVASGPWRPDRFGAQIT